MKKLISLVLAVALVASCFCLEAFAAQKQVFGWYNGREYTGILLVAGRRAEAKMLVHNPVFDGSVNISVECRYQYKLDDRRIVRANIRSAPAEESVECCVNRTMVSANAYFYANGHRVRLIKDLKP